MDPAIAPGIPPASAGFHDGLGERRRGSDANGDPIELLCLRRDLTAIPSFEFALRERASHLAQFRHTYFGRVRSVDRLTDPVSTLAVVSDFTRGVRLSQLLTPTERRPVTIDINAALHLIRQLVSAVAMLHENARDVAHGAIGPERIIVTSNARVVIVEYVLGAALEQLHLSEEQYWQDLRIAVAPSTGLSRFDQRTDVTQIGVVALSLVLGRLLLPEESPSQLGDVLASAWAISGRGDLEPLPAGVRKWIGRALQLDSRHPFSSALEAREELDRVLSGEEDESDYSEEIAEAPQPAEIADTPEPEEVAAAAAPAEDEFEDFVSLTSAAPIEPAPIAPVETFERQPLAPEAPLFTRAATPPAPAPGAKVEKADTKPATPPVTPAHVPMYVPEPRPMFSTLDSSYSRDESYTDSSDGAAAGSGRWMQVAAAAVVLAVLGVGGVYASKRFRAVAASVATTGTLNISSNPAGAMVFVDQVSRGVTPLTLNLQPGTHSVELRGNGDPRTIPVTITAGTQTTQYIELPTTPAASGGQLQVRTEPGSAQVSVDGQPHGKTPVLVDGLAPGEHTVVLEGESGAVKQTVTVQAGMTASLVVPMAATEAATASGWISIAAPVELQIYENKKLLGTSESDRIMVPPGRHEFEIVNTPLAYHVTTVVQVPAGKAAPIKLEWPKGTIAVNAIPWAEVWIDGEKYGETPMGNLSLPIGPHEVVFKNPDLGEQKQGVTVALNAPARLSVDLRKKP